MYVEFGNHTLTKILFSCLGPNLCLTVSSLSMYKQALKNPAYGRRWISQPIWIQAPIQFIYFIFLSHGSAVEVPWKCRWSGKSQQPTATATELPLLLVKLPYYPHFLTISVKNAPLPFFLENCYITGQYWEYVLWPEVFTTPEVGILRRLIHTVGHCESMTDPEGRVSEKLNLELVLKLQHIQANTMSTSINPLKRSDHGQFA